MFLHVFYSWLLAQLIHPIAFMFSVMLVFDRSFYDAGLFFLLMIISMIISIPALVLGYLFLKIIVHAENNDTDKFIFWLAATAILIILNFFVPVYLLYESIEPEMWLIPVPAIISIWVSCLVRFKQFHKLNRSIQYKTYETDLV